MSSRWIISAALATGLLALGVSAAHAADPVDLRGAYVLDTVGAISGDETRVQRALDELWDRTRLQLFVVYVDSFSAPGDPIEWADTTADRNGLGVNDLLLAVAVDARQYALSFDPDIEVTDAQLGDVESAIERRLRDDAWADAAIDGARALEAAVTGAVSPTTPRDPAATGGGIPVLPIIGGVAVVGAGVFVYSRIRKRKHGGAPAGRPEQMTQEELDRRAGSLLVQLDDALKTSEQELGFAIAQFGDEATEEFQAALEGATAKVNEAFGLRQRLDDAVPDTAQQRREWTTRIIELCEAADAELDAQADAFEQLRELEKTAPQALAAVQETANAARQRTDAAQTVLSALASRYATTAIAAIADNPSQARTLLQLADEAMADAEAALSAGDAAEAALAVRTAQQSVGQVDQLAAAIDALGTDLAEASAKLDAALAETRTAIEAARTLPQDQTAVALAPAISAAEAALASAKADDPVAAIERVEAAHAELEKLYAGARAEQERLAHAKAQFDSTVTSARAQLTSAAQYIATRRGGISEVPRTRIVESQRLLAEALALAATDPAGALERAQQARQLASAALSLARTEVQSYESRYSGPSAADLALRGGILGGLLGDAGPGVGGRSSSGSSWSASRSARTSTPSRTARSASFGGRSRTSRRSSGGRRGRGGRF